MEVVVTGIGPMLPNCADRATLWSHLRDGASQLAFEPAPGTVPAEGARWAVGRIRDFDPARWLDRLPRKHYERYQREQQLYLASLLIALTDAGLDLGRVTRERVGLFDGTSRGAFDHWYERAHAERAAAPSTVYSERELIAGTTGQAASLGACLLGVRGPVYTFSNTCCAGSVAIGHALRELADGELDVALATGHDSALSAPIYHMYRAAGLLSEERSDARRAVRPFTGHSSGNAFGEGAITMVLESAEHARARGAVPLARLRGFRYGNNGAHPLSVDKEGGRAAALITQVLERAGVAADDIGFVVGHGNGVVQSDRSEKLYMERLFGARAAAVPLLSVKPIYGHLLGGSSALNVAAATLLLHHRRPSRDGDDLAPPAAGLAVSFGIGGHNSVTLLERA
jgi:3-oxoacyl-[acyl-carrier-protein] synthase II